MKVVLWVTLTMLCMAFTMPSYADGAKAVKGAGEDSALKKATKLKVTSEVVKDEDDSALKKATKLKVLKEAGE